MTSLPPAVLLLVANGFLAWGGALLAAAVAGAFFLRRHLQRASRAVAEEVALLESTLQSTVDGLLVIGEDDRILLYNDRFVEMWRIPADVIARHDRQAAMTILRNQLVDPDEFMQIGRKLALQSNAESFDVIEFRDGRRFERYSKGTLAGSQKIRVWSFRDVTARYASDETLRGSEIRYRLLFEQNAAAVCATKFDGEIIDCNAAFAAMLGERRADLIGRGVRDFYARPVERDEIASLLRDAGTLSSVEFELRRAGGSSAWVLQNLVLVGSGDNAVIHTTMIDVSDRRRAEEQIEFHAYHDVLTDLPNRKLFVDRLRQNLTRARRASTPLAVMFIDLDRFKDVNDTFGHTGGDELLLEMARRLRECVRADDTVARMGGDEFTIVLSELRQHDDAIVVAQKILKTVKRPVTLGYSVVEVTASIGIAVFPEDGADAEALLRNADNAMYRAKDAGRNNYQLYKAVQAEPVSVPHQLV